MFHTRLYHTYIRLISYVHLSTYIHTSNIVCTRTHHMCMYIYVLYRMYTYTCRDICIFYIHTLCRGAPPASQGTIFTYTHVAVSYMSISYIHIRLYRLYMHISLYFCIFYVDALCRGATPASPGTVFIRTHVYTYTAL